MEGRDNKLADRDYSLLAYFLTVLNIKKMESIRTCFEEMEISIVLLWFCLNRQGKARIAVIPLIRFFILRTVS